MLNLRKLQACAIAVEKEWQMSGLATGIYLDFVIEVMKRYKEAEAAEQPCKADDGQEHENHFNEEIQ